MSKSKISFIRSQFGRVARPALFAAVALATLLNLWGVISDLSLVSENHEPQAEHVDQAHLVGLVASGDSSAAFQEAFELGDELFETTFNLLDGVGANVGSGMRFTRVPRADLDGDGQWMDHFPPRESGPNAQACNQCHNQPFNDGAGDTSANIVRDPFRSGHLDEFIIRNTTHVFAMGALQRLAEEMTSDLQAIRASAAERACRIGRPVARRLQSKGVRFGRIRALVSTGGDDDDDDGGSNGQCLVEFDLSQVEGVDGDLVVKPFQWKGTAASLRAFNRAAWHNELGMQPVEMVGHEDGDFDGVTEELTIGDQTALTVYVAAQPRPVTKLELHDLGLIELAPEEIESITRGSRTFEVAGCDSCHVPELTIDFPIFSEPSQHPDFRDAVFPSGQDPTAVLVDPAFPISFDLTADQPDNVIDFEGQEIRLGSFRTDDQGRAIVGLYGDLKRHEMGPGLAESIDEEGTGASNFITKELWGVGSTAPYLHDGRATTLTEAILLHGGEAQRSRNRFARLSPSRQRDVIAFLDNLVLFKLEEEEE